MKSANTSKGFVHILVLFAIFSVIVWYWKIDVRGYIDSHKELRDSLLSMIAFLKGIWNTYLAGAGKFIWDNIIIGVIWKTISALILQ